MSWHLFVTMSIQQLLYVPTSLCSSVCLIPHLTCVRIWRFGYRSWSGIGLKTEAIYFNISAKWKWGFITQSHMSECMAYIGRKHRGTGTERCSPHPLDKDQLISTSIYCAAKEYYSLYPQPTESHTKRSTWKLHSQNFVHAHSKPKEHLKYHSKTWAECQTYYLQMTENLNGTSKWHSMYFKFYLKPRITV